MDRPPNPVIEFLPAENMSASGKKKILIVEDHPILIRLLEEQIEQFGYRVYHAKNGKEALKKTAADLPDLILLDIRLPELDGFQVASMIRQDPKTRSIPILAVSGLPGDKEKCVKSGCNDYLAKPFTIRELVVHVKRLLE
jgi:CheY-like chemotaxis protein